MAAVLAALLVAAACSSGGAEGTSTSTSTASPTSTGGAVSTSTTVPAEEGPYLPEPGLPAGPLPSFNESAGCGVAQGLRGPYATIAGSLDDTEAIRGPWGDFFGRDFAEVREHLVEVALPMTGDREVTVWVHDAVLPRVERAIANLEREEAAGNYYEMRAGDVSSFNPSPVSPKRYLSFHAVGAAIDINTSTNPYRGDNVLITDMPEWFVNAWTDAGWCWGGAWQTIKDPMHFSWQGPLYTTGYPPAVPTAPRTAASPFLRSVTFATVLGPAPDGLPLVPGRRRSGRRPGCDPGPSLGWGGQPGSGDRPGALRLRGLLHPPRHHAGGVGRSAPPGRRGRGRPSRPVGGRALGR